MANRTDAQTAFAQVLMDRVRNDNFPSWTEMDILESALPPEMVREYCEMLIEKVASESRPSITMLRHIRDLVAV